MIVYIYPKIDKYVLLIYTDIQVEAQLHVTHYIKVKLFTIALKFESLQYKI